jgi:transmembrane sensor
VKNASEIEQQAAIWLARRDAHGETAEFVTWLADDPRHRAAYLRLAAAWDRTSRLKVLRAEGSRIDPDLLASKVPYPRRGPRLALAAGVVAVLAASIMWQLTRDQIDKTYRTRVGEISRFVLEDGSTVMLNTDTELHARFDRQHRRISIVRGEAEFTVAHDRQRPFDVSAGGRLVRAVGTAFDIRVDGDDDMQVMVTEGRIVLMDVGRMAVPTTDARLATPVSAGERAVAVGGRITVGHADPEEISRHLAWVVGELSFQGETLAQAIGEFNRYNHRKLRVDDPSIAGLQIGGNFQVLDVDSFVAALGHSFGLTSRTLGDVIVLERPPGADAKK